MGDEIYDDKKKTNYADDSGRLWTESVSSRKRHRKSRTPNLDHIFANYPMTSLGACGLDVGLPDGQMGNSEVGHLNIGAGRIVYQELTRITKDIEDGGFFVNPALNAAMDHALANDSTLHLLGLLSDGGSTATSAISSPFWTWPRKKDLQRCWCMVS